MKKITLLTLAAISLFASCKPEYDEPPIRTIPEGNVLTIQQMKDLYYASGVGFTIEEDYSVYCVVTTDETTGNFYKEVYVQDTTGAIQLRLLNSGGLYRGDSVRLYLKGTYISEYKGMMQLDSVDTDNNVIKQATGATIIPHVTTIDQLNANNDQGKWIKLENVEFSSSDLGSKWSNAVTQTDVNHTLVDCNGNSVIVRTSGYANFADDTIPYLNGTFYGILGVYNTDLQMYIQDPDDLEFTNTRCTGGPALLSKDFEDGSLTSGGWTTNLVTGTLDWTIGTIGGSYANMSNYNGTSNEQNETWLISPAIDLSGASAPGFSFRNAYNYSGPTIEVFLSTDYSGTGDPNNATWTAIPSTLSAGGWAWTDSGVQNLTSYVGQTIYIGFKYTGTTTTGSTWEIDDILIKEY